MFCCVCSPKPTLQKWACIRTNVQSNCDYSQLFSNVRSMRIGNMSNAFLQGRLLQNIYAKVIVVLAETTGLPPGKWICCPLTSIYWLTTASFKCHTLENEVDDRQPQTFAFRYLAAKPMNTSSSLVQLLMIAFFWKCWTRAKIKNHRNIAYSFSAELLGGGDD